jgi:hypothetical protein
MARTRATPAPAANQTTTAIRDEDEVDYGDDTDLTYLSKLERQLAGVANEPTSGHPAQASTQVPAAPEPAVASAPGTRTSSRSGPSW